VTDEAIERLRAESSRGDYASMIRLARALYDAGLGPREVVRQCYGVAFPEEFFAMTEAGLAVLHLLVVYTNQPWEVAIPPDRDGPRPVPHLLDDVERKIYARDPDLVPLVLINTDSRSVGTVICYRLAELQAGRATVFGIGKDVTPRDEVVRRGESLLAVLHEHHVDDLRGLERKWGHPSNRGAGSIDLEDLAEVRSLIERIEELQRQVASRGA
jgi:hypothetical protein